MNIARERRFRSDGSKRRRGTMIGAAVAAGVGVLGLVIPASFAATKHGSEPTVIVIEKNATWGSILALSNGDTVYRLTADSNNKSVCNSACLKFWPPVVLAAGQSSPQGKGISGLGTIKQGSQHQVTYKGIPLYLYVGDKKPGQVTGNIKDSFGRWWVVNPAHPLATPKALTSSSNSGSTQHPTTTAPSSGIAY